MSTESHERPCKNPSIYRVPAFITDLNQEAYRPQVVSFGPYHHYNARLCPMEEHKHRALLNFLKRSGHPHEHFLKSLREVGPDLEESYDALDPKWKGSREFLELMITDGCFMLEIMRSEIMRRKNEKNGKNEKNEKNDYAPNDPIFSPDRLAYITPYIRRDMLMLENQLPMKVLEHLVETEGREREGVHKRILEFYSLNTSVDGTDTYLHVMDVYRKGLLTAKPNGAGIRSSTCVRMMESLQPVMDVFWMMLEKMVPCGHEAGCDKIIWPATELNGAGIRFKKSKTNGLNVDGISFSKGVLTLPVIIVDDDIESKLLNMMTFERLHIGAGTEVTSYVTFMDTIINNDKDVALLQAQGIIENAYGTDEEVAQLFNSLCKDVKLESNNSLETTNNDIRAYCQKPRNSWRANLNRTYFRSPWTILSLVAAIFLFALTIIQTVYAVRGYY